MDKPRPSRSPWQLLYQAAHRRRYAYWQKRASRLPCPVISVGNLHWGGTGKTPVVAALAEFLRDDGRKVCILSRGYGRNTREPLVVSRGEGPLRDPNATGDEPWLLATRLPGVAIVVAKKRFEGGEVALRDLSDPPDIFLLDDGFSHLYLHRDLDIVVLPDDDPFGGGRLLPGGRLREPLEATRRAQVVLLSGRRAKDEEAQEVGQHLQDWGFGGQAFAAPTRVGEVRGPQTLSSEAAVLLVSGIARPLRFERSAAEKGISFKDHLIFSDHHAYPSKTVELIRRRVIEEGLTVLTTEKDYVKLRGRLDTEPHVLPIHTQLPEGLTRWLRGHLCIEP